jgi:O-antigen/teichoic acid export membrane protein
VVSVSAGALAAPRLAVVRAARPQLAVMSGQLAAGAGNLLYAVVLARVLAPGDYSQVVAFLAVYVLMHVPAAAFSAAGALAPDRVDRLVPRLGVIGAAAALALAATSGWVAHLTGIDRPLVLGLAAAAPAAALLGVRRGIAYGHEQLGRVSASLVAEPAVRLGVGVVLAAIAGPAGAAAGTVLAGYAALAVCWTVPARRSEPRAAVPSRIAAATGASFVLMAVLQSLDLLVATRVLDDDAAAQFAVLSTLGGAAFFATATIPLVLMPAAVRGRPHAAPTALALTAGVGIGVAAAGAVLARPLLATTFGEEYRDVAHLVGPYLLAMALLGIVRVEVARLAAERDAVAVTRAGAAIAGAVLVELLGLAAFGTHVGAFVAVTLLTSTTLAVVIELPVLFGQRRAVTFAPTAPTGFTPPASETSVPPAAARAVALAPPVPFTPPRSVLSTARPSLPALLRDRATLAMAGLCLVATAVRVATSRGLWVDEAISVSQAQLPLGEMLADVRTTDVHPPLHHVLLWLTVRVFGTSEAAVRLPSLIAGVALVPALAWVGRVLYDRRTGWIAAVFAVVAPFGVWYSQEARMYSILMLFAALAVGAQVQALRTGRRRHWALYGVLTAAMVWTQYFALLPVAVQTVVTLYVIWRDRHDAVRRRQLLLGAAVAVAIVAVVLAPMVPILRDQLASYGSRGAGLTPGQAGAGSSSLGGTISVYAVGANLIWATLGYHADGVMVQVAALWPLLMLLALVMLGRGRSGRSMLLLALVVVPMAALFAIGSMKRDLFELRYFAGAVPAMLLLGARVVTSTTLRRGPLLTASVAVTALLGVGLVDQQLNGANPRLYDFQGAFDEITRRAEPGDVVLYEPSYLAEVVEYYAPGVDARPVGSPLDGDTGAVFVLATERVMNAEDTAARLGHELAVLDRTRDIVDIFERPNVRVWELQ